METLWETAAAISGLKNLDGLWDYIPRSHSAVTGNPIHYFEHYNNTGFPFTNTVVLHCRSAQGFKESTISGEDKYYQYCNKAFGTWDYALSDGKNVTLKKKSILKEIIVSTGDIHVLPSFISLSICLVVTSLNTAEKNH